MASHTPASTFSVDTATDTITTDMPCYVAGTRILTATGERMVESLLQGDIVLTLANGELTAQPVKWLGRRRIDLTAHPRPETVAPVRIRRGAFADNMPHTDLLVSPDHAIFVDGKLICARQLINGTTIRQEKTWTSVEYFHVELDAHAILLAEGLPAESYLNTGNHGFFANSGEPLVLHPDLTDETDYPTREAGSCAPFVWDEASVRPVWQRLAERAAALGQPAPSRRPPPIPALRLVAKGRTVRPLYGENGLFIFALPKGATEVRLVSRAGAPTDARPWLDDRRRLGVHVERIVLRGASEVREVPLDHPDLSQGWWAVERDGTAMRRWTDGDAVLPLPAVDGATMLEIHLRGTLDYVVSGRRRPPGGADSPALHLAHKRAKCSAAYPSSTPSRRSSGTRRSSIAGNRVGHDLQRLRRIGDRLAVPLHAAPAAPQHRHQLGRQRADIRRLAGQQLAHQQRLQDVRADRRADRRRGEPRQVGAVRVGPRDRQVQPPRRLVPGRGAAIRQHRVGIAAGDQQRERLHQLHQRPAGERGDCARLADAERARLEHGQQRLIHLRPPGHGADRGGEGDARLPAPPCPIPTSVMPLQQRLLLGGRHRRHALADTGRGGTSGRSRCRAASRADRDRASRPGSAPRSAGTATVSMFSASVALPM